MEEKGKGRAGRGAGGGKPQRPPRSKGGAPIPPTQSQGGGAAVPPHDPPPPHYGEPPPPHYGEPPPRDLPPPDDPRAAWRKENTDVIKAAAKHLHLRGYFDVNLAELDEAVRLAIGQPHCDPFDGPNLGEIFTDKQQIAIEFLRLQLDECRKEGLNALKAALSNQRPQDIDAVQMVLHAGVDAVLRQFQRFRLLVAGAAAEAFSLQSLDPFLFAEARREGRVFFAGLCGCWRLSTEGPPAEDDRRWVDLEWKDKQYETVIEGGKKTPVYDDAVKVVREQLDDPLSQDSLVDGLCFVYGTALLWWLMNRSRDPSAPTRLIEDLTKLVAGTLRKFEDRQKAKFIDDSQLRRAFRVEKQFREIHIGDPLRRVISKRRLEKLWGNLLEVVYAEVPRRIAVATGVTDKKRT